jgi:hypothetical protein
MRFIKLGAWTMFLFLAASPAFGQFDEMLHVGLLMPYTSLAGSDFDGTHYFETGGEMIFVPKMKSKLGWGLVVGANRGDTWDYEFYYTRSSFSYTFLDVADKAYLDAIGVNSRFYFVSKGIIRPYANLGVDVAFLRVVNGSMYTYKPYTQGDSHFTGVGIMGGLGLGLVPMSRVLLFIGAEVRWNIFGTAKGLSGEKNQLEDLSSLGISLRSGLCYRFSL